MSLLIQRTSSSDDNVQKQISKALIGLTKVRRASENCQIVTTVNSVRSTNQATTVSHMLEIYHDFPERWRKKKKKKKKVKTCRLIVWSLDRFSFLGRRKLLTCIYSYYFNCSHAVSFAHSLVVCSFPCGVRRRRRRWRRWRGKRRSFLAKRFLHFLVRERSIVLSLSPACSSISCSFSLSLCFSLSTTWWLELHYKKETAREGNRIHSASERKKESNTTMREMMEIFKMNYCTLMCVWVCVCV